MLGPVVRVEGGPGGSRLAVDRTGEEILIPLAVEICIEIDVAAGRIKIEPLEGLLDLNRRT